MCARGILLSDISFDFVRSELLLFGSETWPRVGDAFASMRKDGDDWLAREGLADAPRLARELQVAEGWETAVEVVLGHWLQSVIVAADAGHGQTLDELLHSSLDLLDDLRGGTQARAGSLAEKVQAPDAVLDWLNGVMVADSWATAWSGRDALGEGESLITADGEWLGRGWIRVARGPGGQDSMLEREKMIARLTGDVAKLGADFERIAGEVGALHCPSSADEQPTAIVDKALDEARRSAADVLIIDTAGRLHVDDDMMSEAAAVHERSGALETLFVVDSMAGQDAVNAATAFGEALPLTGVILSKADGDAKGGVALSVREITGKPIRFMGVGEKVDALEAFHPERMASRILGMGDVLTLVEEIEEKVSKEKTEKLAKKLKKGRGFDLSDLKDQLEQMMNMGGLASMLEKLPLPGNVNPAALQDSANEQKIKRQIAIINSMTPAERANPALLNGSRRKRIADGSGTSVPEVNRLVKQFDETRKMMKMMKRSGTRRAAR